MEKKTKIILALIASIPIAGILLFAFFALFFMINWSQNEKEMAQELPYGISIIEVRSKTDIEIVDEKHGPSSIDEIFYVGYVKPKRPLAVGETLLRARKYDYMLYLYFKDDKLIHREFCGS
jgi:hypothetical protein